MRWPALLLALLLAFVGTSTRDTASDRPGSGLNAPVSAVHVQTTASPDACWALPGPASGPRPPQGPAAVVVAAAQHVEGTTSGHRSSRAPPHAAAPGSTHP
ncbi:hypothetical protein [Lentzea sp. NEAU-D7]|uniref:hypothetical protein n=1 Tax=Lentzea sp. NEAU-D7 TaxID=2994667 RepID=UPI00224ADFA3|nr:hypothetical protein [Lentzea sp. NEAU-D7]MCX2948654.1 hypothetical protein [Lentzea sp. NEAU-D7]MCX2951212.1 hypothetical protein [Lentzea sp. NEAU-D7]